MTKGHMAPKEDKQQDWNVTNVTEMDGVTTMEFNRLKDTGDNESDNVIGVSTVCNRPIISKYPDWIRTSQAN